MGNEVDLRIPLVIGGQIFDVLVRALEYGPLCAHRVDVINRPEDRGRDTERWTVTHVASGYALTGSLGRVAATRTAEALARDEEVARYFASFATMAGFREPPAALRRRLIAIVARCADLPFPAVVGVATAVAP